MASGRQRGAFSVLIEPKLPKAVAMEDRPIERHEQRVDKPNPNAPAELSRFAFLIGRWRFEAKLKSVNGEWQTIGSGTWFGHFILDGYAIADEYRMIGSSEELIVLGINFRAYDSAKQVWNIKWLNALAGTRTELTSKQFGGGPIRRRVRHLCLQRARDPTARSGVAKEVSHSTVAMYARNVYKYFQDSFHLASRSE
ncbi:MAG TPA: hypothetical protein VI320_38080 [Terracidiphilus sp.]|jgi:hypothetical protein